MASEPYDIRKIIAGDRYLSIFVSAHAVRCVVMRQTEDSWVKELESRVVLPQEFIDNYPNYLAKMHHEFDVAAQDALPVLQGAVRGALVTLYQQAQKKGVDLSTVVEANCFVGKPWYVADVFDIHYDKTGKDRSQLTDAELNEIKEKVSEKFRLRLESFGFTDERQLLEDIIISTKVNGYLVDHTNWDGVQTIDIEILISALPSKTAEYIESQVRNLTKGLDLGWHSLAHTVHLLCSRADQQPANLSGSVVVVNADITEIVSFNAGKPVKLQMLPFSFENFELTKHNGVDVKQWEESVKTHCAEWLGQLTVPHPLWLVANADLWGYIKANGDLDFEYPDWLGGSGPRPITLNDIARGFLDAR